MDLLTQILNSCISFFIKNWEPTIALLGLCLSVFNFIILIRNNHKKISIKELFYLKIKISDCYIYEYNMIIINKSRLPISIVDINIKNNDKEYSAKIDKQIIANISNGTEKKLDFFSSDFPINLDGLESSKETVIFKIDNNLDCEYFDIVITTSRGIIKKRLNYNEKIISSDEYLKNISKSI